MTTLLSARGLSKAFPANVLFEDVAVHIDEGERTGLIGPNGAGKSTLLKVIAGLEDPSEGEVIRRRGLELVYVPQEDRFADDATPISSARAGLEASGVESVEATTRASIALSKLGFTDFDRPVSSLSGGWRKRLSIACALSLDPDVLLLDEPTNHLDLEGILWLEDFVRKSMLAMIFVTHDRQFLENTVDRMIELSAAYPGGTFEARGNYSEFVRRKGEFLDAQASAESAIANKVRRDTAWLRQGIQARQTRNKTQVSDAAARRAQLKATKDRNTAPQKTTTIDFQATERKTKKLLALHNVSKAMGGKHLFGSLELTLRPGQRIGLLGANGSGKTTLLRLMAGELEPDTGTIKRAAELRVVTFSQHRSTLDQSQTLQDALCPGGDMVDYRGKMVHVTGWARRFLFEPDQLATFVHNLSGGEQARLLIANLMLQPADVLLLDEPTNDLDIPSLEVLEEALLEFPGALMFVTHDRFMLERIATEYIGIDGIGAAKAFQTYRQWNKHRKDVVASARKKNAPTRSKVKRGGPASRQTTSSGGRKFSFNEKREYEQMEEAILAAEGELEALQATSEDPGLVSDHVKAARVYEELTAAQLKVKELYARWTELEAIQSGS